MVTENQTLDNSITNKHQFRGNDDEVDSQIMIFKEKFRLWNKITRVSKDGTEVAVLIPYNVLIEPFFSTDDIDMTVAQCGIYNSTNHNFELYSDANGNYKYIQSKVVTLRQNHQINNIFINVECVDNNGDNAISKIVIDIFNGNEWISVNNGSQLTFKSYSGDDLDADLDATPAANFVNYDDPTFLYQHAIKYRITRISSDIVYVNKVTLRVTWNF